MVPGMLQTSVWVVIAAYNEARVIASVLSELVGLYHVVVVDDGSQDTTGEAAGKAGAWVVPHPVNLGQGAALQTGIKFALAQRASHIVTFDADGQHRAADIPRLIEALDQGHADFALGSRFLGQDDFPSSRHPAPAHWWSMITRLRGCMLFRKPGPAFRDHAQGASVGMPFSRRLLLKAATWFTCVTTGLRVTDTHNGLRAMTRRGAQSIALRQNRMAHASELLDQIGRCGLAYVEVPVTIEYSGYSLAKGQRLSDSLAILFDLSAQRLTR
jgi:hypothetical protein